MSKEHRTLCDLLRQRAHEQPEQIAYIYRKGDEPADEIRITYGELDRRARGIAATIRSTSQVGDRAILLYPPGLEFIAAFFGCLYAGVIAVPAYPPRINRGFARLQAIVNDCQAVVALSTQELSEPIRAQSADAPELKQLRWIATDALEPQHEARWQAPTLDGSALAFLQYTSGSTGTPKGVMVSHGNLIHNLQCLQDRWGHSSRSVGVSWLPHFHDMGLIAGVLQPLYVGYPAVLISPAAFIEKPYRWLKALSDHRGTTTCAPNFAFDLCVSKVTPEQRRDLELSCVETVMNGAEPILVGTLRNFAQAFSPSGFNISAFRGGYGLAEGTLFVTTSSRSAEGPQAQTLYKSALEQHRVAQAPVAGPDAQEVVCCGSTASDQEVVIVQPDVRTRCRPDQIGEIWVKGPSVAQGYWQRPEESAATFQAVLADTGEGPFLRTGDLGFLHDNELYITGRMKDLIIVRGRNHYPQDLERTVECVHPSLRPSCAAAFSVRDNGEERVVVVQEIKRRHADVDLDRLIEDIFQAVAGEHELSLHAIVLIREGDISKTSSGKIQRAACRQRYESGDFKVVHQATFAVSPKQPALNGAGFFQRFHELDAEECRSQVESYLIRTLRAARPGFVHVDVHHSLVKTGLDSLAAAELRSVIERDLRIVIPLSMLMETSIRALSDELVRQLTANERVDADADVASRVDAMSDAEVNALLDEMLSVSEGQR